MFLHCRQVGVLSYLIATKQPHAECFLKRVYDPLILYGHPTELVVQLSKDRGCWEECVDNVLVDGQPSIDHAT